MLGKLIKYEFGAIGRKMGPMYLVIAALSIVMGIMLRMYETGSGSESDGQAMHRIELSLGVLGTAFAVMIIVMAVMLLVMLIQRFSRTVYGTEGYFYMTLPAGTGEHIWNKTISAVIWSALTLLVVMGSFAVVVLIGGIMKYPEMVSVDPLFATKWSMLPMGKVILAALLFICLMIISAAEFALLLYASIAAGNSASGRRGLFSTIWFIVFSIASSIVEFRVIKWTSDFIDNADYFRGNEIGTLVFVNSSLTTTNMMLLVNIAVSAAVCAVFFLITYFLVDRKLNLE
ncbi:MAG: hypothetical protein SOV71_02235 [Anaerovoracaceae bacterium]|nr:hypothetical protein [Bacillota bacterium]MDY2670356.1 hypothetical protein [Anaerovoracaceae bacterium]